MAFPFPDVAKKCLRCGRGQCARWKGYYVRRMICGALEFDGEVAIHVGYCRNLSQDFSYFPDFLIPKRRLSRTSWQGYAENFKRLGVVKECIDDLVSRVPDFTMALSSAYDLLYSLVKVVRLQSAVLAVPFPEQTSVVVMRRLGMSVVRDLFASDLSWRPAFHINLHPP